MLVSRGPWAISAPNQVARGVVAPTTEMQTRVSSAAAAGAATRAKRRPVSCGKRPGSDHGGDGDEVQGAEHAGEHAALGDVGEQEDDGGRFLRRGHAREGRLVRFFDVLAGLGSEIGAAVPAQHGERPAGIDEARGDAEHRRQQQPRAGRLRLRDAKRPDDGHHGSDDDGAA